MYCTCLILMNVPYVLRKKNVLLSRKNFVHIYSMFTQSIDTIGPAGPLELLDAFKPLVISFLCLTIATFCYVRAVMLDT